MFKMQKNTLQVEQSDNIMEFPIQPYKDGQTKERSKPSEPPETIDYMSENPLQNSLGMELKRKRICYARVSSVKQSEDLERQVQDLQKEYPDHELVKDIGSGVNFSRKGFKALVESIIDGDIEELVISHKDRLTRFGYELIEQICKKFECTIVVQFKDERHSPEQELADDLLAITTVFVAKHNGLRAGEKKRKRKESKETKTKKRRESSEDEGTISEVSEN